MAQEFGALLHFNMGTFTNEEQATADLAVDTFAPSDLDIDQWLDACVSAGMRYAALTVKHSDGFALWPTAYAAPAHDPYSIAQTTWYAGAGNPDIVSLFVTKCRTKGLNPCLYFSMQDRTYEARSGKTDVSDPAAFVAMVETQLNELLSNYGAITALWLDSWWGTTRATNVPYQRIYEYIKARQPNCLMILNVVSGADVFLNAIDTYESTLVPSGNTDLAETIDQIRVNGEWFYDSTSGQADGDYKAAATLNANIATVNGRNGTYLLGLTPDTTGHLPAAQVTRLGQLHT